MSIVFLLSFLLGLILAVSSMLRGVERTPRGGESVDALGRALETARTSLKAPVAAASLTLFGATGYLLTRYTALGAVARASVALIAAVLGVLAAVLVIAKWIIPSAQHDHVDELYLLQVHLARVSAPITPGAPGEIVYDLGGTRHASRACSLDGSPVPAGTEVVIERVED